VAAAGVAQVAVVAVAGAGWTMVRSCIKLNLDVLNIPNTQESQIDYFCTSRLPGELAEGVADRHFHPVEPTASRLSLAKAF
jgi:hypothetical protein